jgi:hypothetical protein
VVVITPGFWDHYQLWYLNIDARQVKGSGPRLRDAALASRLAAKRAAFALRCRVTTTTFTGAAMKYPISVAALVFLLVGGVGAEPVLAGVYRWP